MSIFKRSGGGFLNGVEGVITSYKFAAREFISEKTGNPYTKLSVELVVLPDGAEEGVQQFLDAGFFRPAKQAISEDGLTLQAINDDGDVEDLERSPWGYASDSEFVQFMVSLVEAGFPEQEFGVGANFEALIGTRVRFARKVDEKATKERGKRKGKDGKEYNRDVLLVEAVLGRAEVKKGGAKKAAAKTAAPKATGAKAAAKKTAPDTSAVDGVVAALVAEKEVPYKGLGGAFVRYALKAGIAQEDRKAIQATLLDEAYLNDATERGIIVFDGTTVAAAV